MKKTILLSILCCMLAFTVNGQNYWEIIDVPDTIHIMCMAANNQNHIFLGTKKNGGLYKSVDNCNSWEFFGFKNNAIPIIELNVLNHFFIPHKNYIYKSIDNGISWDTICYNHNTNCIGVFSLKCYNENLIFAGIGGNTGDEIIRSRDNGENWEKVFALPYYNTDYFNDIAIQNQDTIYAGTTNWFDNGGVYRSIDGGDNWEHIGMYNFHVFSLELNSQGDLFVGTYGGNTQYWLSGVYVLYNGDNEFTQLYTTLVNDMTINSDDDLYVATDYGVLESLDNGQTLNFINDGLFTGNVDDLAIDSAGYLYASSYNPCNMARSIDPTITGINKIKKPNFKLSAFPNPFYNKTTISYTLRKSSSIFIKVFDIYGKEVKTLGKEIKNAGINKTELNARDLQAGVYFYSLFINEKLSDTKKMVIVR